MSQASERIKALFDEALELEASKRPEWLDAIRTREPEAAARIERMLVLDGRKVDPFGSAINALKQTLDFDAASWINRRIGDFQLLKLLGQGGMGAVFLAERHTRGFQQLVALKVLRSHAAASADIERFADERRILARLHHPNIGLFIDAGATTEGRPFLVMEYVEGVPLLDYCDRRCMGLQARLTLMQGLLAALTYAHRCLVVHRDLKPSNMLVTNDGTPKLLDFGIARLVDPNASPRDKTTQIFTPEYASPEQLVGEPVGTGSDIYSLGLVLYELCAGVLPWESGARPFTRADSPTGPSQRLRHLDPAHSAEIASRRSTRMRQLTRQLHGDLGRILVRCLEPDPANRYSTVQELDVDLSALLDMRPPPGIQVPRRERILALARRHAWPLALTMLLIVAGGALMVQTLLGQHKLKAQRDRAIAAAESARVEAVKSTQIASFVRSMLAGIDPDHAKGMDRALMRLVLDSAAQRAKDELAGQPEIRTSIEQTIGESYNAIAEYKLAVQHFDIAFETAQRNGDVGEQVELSVRKARALGNSGNMKEGLNVARQSAQLAAVLPPESRARLFAESTLAGFSCDIGDFESCRQRYARTLAIQQRVLGDTDADTEETLLGLARANTALAHYQVAQRMYSRAIKHYRARYGNANSRTLGAINGLAINYLEAKQYADAEKLLRPAVALATKRYGRNHQITLGMYSNLGGAIRQQPGRNEEARPYYEHFLAAMQSMHGADSNFTVSAEMNLALLLRDSGALDEAARHARTAVAHMDHAYGSANPTCAVILTGLASILIRQHNFPAAERALDRGWQLLDGADGFGPTHPAVQAIVDRYVELYAASGNPRRATAWRARRKPPATGAQHGP